MTLLKCTMVAVIVLCTWNSYLIDEMCSFINSSVVNILSHFHCTLLCRIDAITIRTIQQRLVESTSLFCNVFPLDLSSISRKVRCQQYLPCEHIISLINENNKFKTLHQNALHLVLHTMLYK